MYINRSKQASALSRWLWAEFRIHGYPAKVGVNVEAIIRVLDAQRGKCYDCGIDLDMSCRARLPHSEKTLKIICENCHARPEN